MIFKVVKEFLVRGLVSVQILSVVDFTYFLFLTTLFFGGVDALWGLNGEVKGVSKVGSLWQSVWLRGEKWF